jgi:hypothetical protein
MKNFTLLFSFVFTICVCGCDRVEIEQSTILHEDAVVVDTIYTPSRHDTEVGLTAIKMGGMGMDFGGDVGMRLGGGLQVSNVEVPEEFAVVFKCKHGKFIVERKEIYDKVKGGEGKNVDVSYTEVYRVTYKKKDGKEHVINRVLTKYHLVDVKFK